jgi:putative addiction module component (TIGR02574 family)
MSTDLIEAVKALPIDEQRRVVDELCQHIEEIDAGLTPEQAAILDRRVESIRKHPERLVPWEQVNARALETIKNARQK